MMDLIRKETGRWDLPTESKAAELTIAKSAEGTYRWLMITSSAFEDRDGEILSQAAQTRDVERMQRTKEFGYLNWWHVGEPTASHPVPTMVPLILGQCDFAAMDDACRIESGYFINPEVGAALAAHATELSGSLTFLAPDPDAAGVYGSIKTIGRSVLPRAHASNLLADFATVKEAAMPMEPEKIKELQRLAGDAPVEALLADSQARQKAAQAAGVRHKEAKPHKHTVDGVEMEHSHSIADDEPEGKHAHTESETQALTKCAKEVKPDLKAVAKELGGTDIETRLSKIEVMLQLIVNELEQAEDRAGVQEDPSAEAQEVLEAAAMVKELKAKETLTMHETALREMALQVKELKAALAELRDDAPAAVRAGSVTGGDRPGAAAFMTALQARQKESSDTPKFMQDLFPQVFGT